MTINITKSIAHALVKLKAYKITEDGRIVTSNWYWIDHKDEIMDVIEIKTKSYLLTRILSETDFNIDIYFKYFFDNHSGYIKAYMYEMIK